MSVSTWAGSDKKGTRRSDNSKPRFRTSYKVAVVSDRQDVVVSRCVPLDNVAIMEGNRTTNCYRAQ